ncbi:MAG: flavin reductase family protein [Deltaproteobacteria bacterium]|nr:flavin reductase family protein [Deltaproteobacteria bacterium]
MSEDKKQEELAKALGRIPSGIGVLITQDEEENPQTLLCSWFQQLSFDPPLIGVAIKKGSEIGNCIQDSELFVLNILADGDQKNSIAYLECELRHVFEIGDHRLYVGEAVAGKLNEEGAPQVHLRRDGFKY